MFSSKGSLTAHVGASFVPMLGSGSIVAVKGWLATGPTGSSVVADINKNGTTIFGTQSNRPTWTTAGAGTIGAFSVNTFADGDRFSVDLDFVGSTTPGSDLVIVVYVLRTG